MLHATCYVPHATCHIMHCMPMDDCIPTRHTWMTACPCMRLDDCTPTHAPGCPCPRTHLDDCMLTLHRMGRCQDFARWLLAKYKAVQRPLLLLLLLLRGRGMDL